MTPDYESAPQRTSVRARLAAMLARVDAATGEAPACDLAKSVDMPARYIVHEAGELQPDGSQCCARCGLVLLEGLPSDSPRLLADGESFGFPSGRRVIVGPTCTFLVTADRLLGVDEEPCV